MNKKWYIISPVTPVSSTPMIWEGLDVELKFLQYGERQYCYILTALPQEAAKRLFQQITGVSCAEICLSALSPIEASKTITGASEEERGKLSSLFRASIPALSVGARNRVA